MSALLIACGLAGDLDQDTGMESPLVDLLRSRRLAEHDDGTVGSAALALGLAGALGARDAIREVATNPWLGEASWRSVAIASTLLWDGDPSRWKLEEGAELSPELWSALAAAHGFRRDEKAARFLGEVIADPSHPDRVRLQATLALCWSRTWVRDSLFADMNREAHVPVLLTETERFMLDLPWYPWVW